MNVTEANRARHLVIHLDRGDELPAALLRALHEHEARAGWISGTGSIEGAELSVDTPDGRELRRRIEGVSSVVTMTGNVATEGGVLGLQLSVTLARETETGLALTGGVLIGGRARSLDLHVTVFDDMQLQRVTDAGGQLGLAGRKHSSVLVAEPARPPAPAPAPALVEARAAAPVVVPPARGSEPQAAPVYPPVQPAAQAMSGSAVMPLKPVKPKDDLDAAYPEIGDSVNHFAFGECTVIASNGDQISLRSDPDGRVRAVALAMLRIEPQPDGPDGKRHFKLARKN